MSNHTWVKTPQTLNNTTVLLKFNKITVILPIHDQMTISDLKEDFIEALNSTKSRPNLSIIGDENFEKSKSLDNLSINDDDNHQEEFNEKSFKLFRRKQKKTNSNVNGNQPGSSHSNEFSDKDWIGIEDEDNGNSTKSSNKKLSHLINQEAEVIGVGFRSSDGTYSKPKIEVWKEIQEEQVEK